MHLFLQLLSDVGDRYRGSLEAHRAAANKQNGAGSRWKSHARMRTHSLPHLATQDCVVPKGYVGILLLGIQQAIHRPIGRRLKASRKASESSHILALQLGWSYLS